mmetsp:Transcript_51573/g.137973  ORF Transcript_51573/g.137973 Transcript_51573/m.137973 type:complete len:230 (+) Transcript_51573:162-851(+)
MNSAIKKSPCTRVGGRFYAPRSPTGDGNRANGGARAHARGRAERTPKRQAPRLDEPKQGRALQRGRRSRERRSLGPGFAASSGRGRAREARKSRRGRGRRGGAGPRLRRGAGSEGGGLRPSPRSARAPERPPRPGAAVPSGPAHCAPRHCRVMLLKENSIQAHSAAGTTVAGVPISVLKPPSFVSVSETAVKPALSITGLQQPPPPPVSTTLQLPSASVPSHFCSWMWP